MPELVGHIGGVIQDRKGVVAPLGLGRQHNFESVKSVRVLLVEWPRNLLVEVFKDVPLPLIKVLQHAVDNLGLIEAVLARGDILGFDLLL